MIETANMKLSHLLPLGSLISVLVITQSPANAVPGWAQTSRNLEVSPNECTNSAGQAIKKVTGTTGTFDKISATTFLRTTYPQGTTGVFIYCVSNPKKACNDVTSTLMIVAFSDKSSTEAVKWRDKLNQAVGNPIYIDCGINLNPVQED